MASARARVRTLSTTPSSRSSRTTMPVLVIGSIALDSTETPFGKAEEVLGGAGSYFSLAASVLTPVRLVGVVGADLPECHLETLRSRGVDLAGLQRVENGKTFRWAGRYE